MSRRMLGMLTWLVGTAIGLSGCNPDTVVPGQLETTKPRMDREVETTPPAPAPKAEPAR